MNITTATTAELVTFFNANCAFIEAAPVKKFADRKTAERRVQALIDALPAPKAEKVVNADTTALSAGVAASWLNPAVAAARSERTQVLAGTPGAMQHFRSVRQAFRHFNLPDSKHIAFRMAFKAGELDTFDGITFAVAAAE